jgi:serpin B
MALAMVYNGAKGEARQDIQRTLALAEADLSVDEINRAYADLMAAAKDDASGVQLAIANAIWVQHGLHLEPEFKRRMARFYDAEVDNLDFASPDAARVINDWVAGKTRGKIPELVEPGSLTDIVLALVNAIYFKGRWTTPFDESRTRDGEFMLLDGRRKTCPMMSRRGRFSHLEGDDFQAVSLPYGDGRLSMVVILPRSELNVYEFQRKLEAAMWRTWMSQFDDMEGNVVLPRFTIQYRALLKDALTALGMGVAFSSGADFGGISPEPLAISKVIHEAVLDVNEEGSEAAAATAVMMTKSLALNTFSMIVNRPFLCAICDNQTGAVLFAGLIVEPM